MLKKIIFLITCTNMAVATPFGATTKSTDKDFTQRQISALKAIRVFSSLASGAGMASGFVSTFPKGTPCIVKASLFVPVSLIFAAVGYQAWEECNMDGYYKRQKWLLMGL